VDLEVEIFDVDGSSTGLLFYVQLKATDQIKDPRRLRLDHTHLDYLSSLDLPTLIVHFRAADQRFRARWHFDLPSLTGDQKSHSYTFDERDDWREQTPKKIESALWTLRLMRSHRAESPIAVRVVAGSISNAQFQVGRRTVGEIIENTPGLVLSQYASDTELVVDVVLDGDAVTTAIGELASIKTELDSLEMESLSPAILYSLAAMFHRSRLLRHANLLAGRCLKLGLKHHSPELAYYASLAMGTNADAATRLAIINGLHLHPVGRPAFTTHLLSAPLDKEDRAIAFRSFTELALTSTTSARERATIHYNMGNFCASQLEFYRAVENFNRARHANPEYCGRDYFLRELGGALFGCGRYALSATLYRTALKLDDSQLMHLRFGDALLLAGHLREANGRFKHAAEGEGRAIAVEADLKRLVSEYLLRSFGDEISPKSDLANDLLDRKEWRAALKANPLDALANFNVGLGYALDKHHLQATLHFLVCAIRQSGDGAAWTNALISALNAEDAALGSAVLECALNLGGSRIIEGFRTLYASRASADDLAALDAAIFEIGTKSSQRLVLRVNLSDQDYVEVPS
jgi:tetratricopeptide (TPR) repeat protein